MNTGIYTILAIVGALYLTSWPIRVELWKRSSRRISFVAVVLPGFAGILLVAADIIAITIGKIVWGYLPAFVHSFLFLVGIIYAVRYLSGRRE